MAFHFNGFGTGYVGRHNPGPDGTFVLTEWVLVLFVPIIPLKSVRVLSEGDLSGVPFFYASRSMRCVPVALDGAHVRRVYTGLGITALIIGALIWWVSTARSG